MTYVGNTWTQLAYWENGTGTGYLSQLRLIAYSTQDIANNKSTIHWQWQKSVTGGSVFWNDSHVYSVTCGTSTSWNFALGSQSSTSWTNVGSENTTSVTHNDDGTKSVGWSCSGYQYWLSVSSSGTIELPTIARASVPSASPNPLVIGSSGATVTINTNRKSTSFSHSIYLTCGSWTSETKSNVTDSTTFTVPYSVIAQFGSTAKTATCTISCVTYNGSTNIGTKTSTFTLQINTSVDHPNIGTITVEDTNSRTSSIVGAETFIYGISTLKATIPLTVSGSYTQLASAVVTCGTNTENYTLSGTSETITFTAYNVNANSLTVTVKDKRGTTVSKTKTYTLMAYQPETLTATVGRVTAVGSTAVGQVSGVAYGGNYGQASNSLTITYKYKEHDATTWTDSTYSVTLSLNEGQQTYTHAITLLEEYDYQKQYDIQFIVNDLFNTATYECRLMQGLPIVSWDETEFDVWGSLHIHNRDNPTVYQDVMQGFDGVLAHNQKNLLAITTGTTVVNGITYTVNSDGSIKATGTATAYSSLSIGTFEAVSGLSYILSGCPEGGGTRTYSLGVNSTQTKDTGEGVTFTATGTVTIYADVFNGQTVDITFYPMVRDARIASDEYVPYWTDLSGAMTVTGSQFTVSEKNFWVKDGWGFLYVKVLGNFTSSHFPNGGNKDLQISGVPLPHMAAVNGMTYNGGVGVATRLHNSGLLRFRNIGNEIGYDNVELIATFSYPVMY